MNDVAFHQLTMLVGRARALEIIVASDDVDAAQAERYGLINRALPDDELDGFVDSLARRHTGYHLAIAAHPEP